MAWSKKPVLFSTLSEAWRRLRRWIFSPIQCRKQLSLLFVPFRKQDKTTYFEFQRRDLTALPLIINSHLEVGNPVDFGNRFLDSAPVELFKLGIPPLFNPHELAVCFECDKGRFSILSTCPQIIGTEFP